MPKESFDECFREGIADTIPVTRRIPERIPDISLMHWPLVSESRSSKLREVEHSNMVSIRKCHAYEGLEYHYCGRKRGRMFPLAPAASRPTPTLPNPNVDIRTGKPAPNYSARLKEIEKAIERQAEEDRRAAIAKTVRTLGPATAKATRFDFGRRVR